MNLNQIQSFAAVSQTLNFTNAAKTLGVPQSSISRQIHDLEAQLGVPLFHRTKRSVALTEEGRIFLPYAKEMLEAADKGSSAVRQINEGSSGVLNLSSISTSGKFLSACLKRFGHLYPDIIVNLTYISSGDALLEEGDDPYDFHFMHEAMLPANDLYDTMTTHRDKLCLVHCADRSVLPDALEQEKFILVSERESPILSMYVEDFFHSCHFTPRVVNYSDDVHAVMVAVSADLGITILPSSQPREYLTGYLTTIPLDVEIAYAVAWRRELLNPAARLFLETLRQECDDIGYTAPVLTS